ncbi:hypothetical protein MMC10_008878 [Thelotrema lepadinum]|nr:hypothetical protein [Thelotrema lepadinum]
MKLTAMLPAAALVAISTAIPVAEDQKIPYHRPSCTITVTGGPLAVHDKTSAIYASTTWIASQVQSGNCTFEVQRSDEGIQCGNDKLLDNTATISTSATRSITTYACQPTTDNPSPRYGRDLGLVIPQTMSEAEPSKKVDVLKPRKTAFPLIKDVGGMPLNIMERRIPNAVENALEDELHDTNQTKPSLVSVLGL